MITVSALGLHGTEETFTCTAIGDSLMNGASTVEITVRPIPGKRGNLGLIIGLVIGIPVALAILSLLVGKCLQKYHPEYLPRKGCGWNPCCWRPHEPEQLHEEEELMGSPRSSVWLTKEQVQRCQEELKEHYRTSRSKIPVAPLNFLECAEMDEINPNLSITDGRKSTTITYGDLLTNVSKRPLIVGEEGVGKTTLCSKIAWDWCQGRILQDLDMVVLVSISDVTNGKSISDIIKTYLSDSNTATTIQIEKYISVNQNKILLVFDGFDEYNGELCGSEVICILRSEQYMSCKVIVTTRSWRAIEFLEDIAHTIAYTLIGIEGFDRKDLSEYINRYFRTHGAGEMVTLGENLITFMEENDIVWLEMAPYPIYCATFCLMWSELSEARREEIKKSETISQVFEEIISFLKEHYASEVCGNRQTQNSMEHLKEADMAIQDISWIALNGLLDRKHSFREEQFKECRDAMETCCRVGVLAVERDVDVTCFVVPMVSFSHKLFQEYAAGKYIEHLFANDGAKYNDLKKTLLSRYEEFRYILYFTSALGNELCLDIIDSLLECSDQDYCVDVAFECNTEEAARVVGKQWE
ncbi:NACHT, LRR and PYD domains-containing protein 3-like [Diadema antillarum]|uniref:NACHT, LRR and PYD domains-containing protein 3-like n=1 Tax=Diadema antillarum TaxID=105358 RepID=UPI003A83F283